MRADAVWTNMSGNIRFPDLPITMDDLKAEIVCFDETITEALDGSRTAFAAKRSQREVVTKKLRILGHYVEENCDNDPATFLTSGFELASTTRVPSQPLPPTVVRKITQGKSGTLWIKMQAVPKARKYELRHGEKGTDVDGRKIDIFERKISCCDQRSDAWKNLRVSSPGLRNSRLYPVEQHYEPDVHLSQSPGDDDSGGPAGHGSHFGHGFRA